MDLSRTIHLPELDGNRQQFKVRQLITDIPLDSAQNESITYISTYQANLYIATSLGQILHYHKFEDAPEYFLISRINVGSERRPINKLLVLSYTERILILSGDTVYVYTLPELSTCRIGKIKDVSYILHLTQLKKSIPNPPNDKAIVYTSDKIHLIQFSSDLIKSLKVINYSKARKGISCSSGTSLNYSNLCLVANDKNYDIVDLQQTRKIPLFEYTLDPSEEVEPFIVQFKNNSGNEEFLLTARSDATASISMFINSLGDVTRGTISWMNEGYPSNGLVIHWPYVIGIFTSPEGSTQLIFSSLESLDIRHKIGMSDLPTQNMDEQNLNNFKICEVNSEINFNNESLESILKIMTFTEKEISAQTENNSSGKLLIYNNNQIFLFHEEDEVVALFSRAQDLIMEGPYEDLISTIDKMYELKSNAKQTFILQLKMLILIASHKFNEAETLLGQIELDPRFFLLAFNVKAPENFSSDFATFTGIKTIISLVKDLNITNDSFISLVLQKYYKQPNVPHVTSYLRYLLYTTNIKSNADLITLINDDQGFWESSESNKIEILKYMEEKKFYFALLHILLLQQAHEPNEMNAVKICDLTVKLLKEEISDENFDLVKITFKELKDHFNDSEAYNKYLLEMLKICPNDGVAYLKANKTSKHKQTHNSILKDISRTYQGELDFNSLKIEYLESTIESSDASLESIDELLTELSALINHSHETEEVINFNILKETYKLEHSLADPEWPKISWIDYLSINKNRSECKKFTENYLKVFELLLFRFLRYPRELDHLNELKEILNKDYLEYLQIFFENENTIENLFNLGDYSSAEVFIIYNALPFPSKPIYFNDFQKYYKIRSDHDIKIDLQELFHLYMSIDNEQSKILTTRHFITMYGDYFEPTEILKFIPAYVPLPYIKEYLYNLIINFESRKRGITLKKLLSRVDSKFNERLYKDLQ